jgi:hypothetical protein
MVKRITLKKRMSKSLICKMVGGDRMQDRWRVNHGDHELESGKSVRGDVSSIGNESF